MSQNLGREGGMGEKEIKRSRSEGGGRRDGGRVLEGWGHREMESGGRRNGESSGREKGEIQKQGETDKGERGVRRGWGGGGG